MGIEKGELFLKSDIYIDYDYEEVMYRWDHKKRKVYVKFYGESEMSESVSYENRLFNEALRFGERIDKQKYLTGKAKKQ